MSQPKKKLIVDENAIETATGAAAEATAKAVTAFDEVAEHLNKHGLAGPTEPAGEVSTVTAAVDKEIADASVRASNELVEATAALEATQVELPAPALPSADDVEAARIAGQNDALALQKKDIVEAPRKPLINWLKVSKYIADLGETAYTHYCVPFGNMMKKFGQGVLLSFMVFIYLVLNILPAAVFGIGWVSRYFYNCAIKGWKQELPVLADLHELIGKYEKADVTPAPVGAA